MGVGPTPGPGVLMRRAEDMETLGKGLVRMEAEIGGLPLQAKALQGSPQGLRQAGKDPFLEPLRWLNLG